MDSMFINKIAGAVLLTVLIGFAITEVSHVLVHPHKTDTVAYPVPDMPVATAAAALEEEVIDMAALMAGGDAAKGAKVFNKCKACHTVEEGGKVAAGPNLFGILDRDIAETGFGYSATLKELEGNWTYEALNGFLTNPKKYAKGTKMAFGGLKKPSDRADVIMYLRSFGDADTPLPAAQ